ncbi:MAG: DNA-processing protein DprA [Ardenticatenaceae bacterium]|nr:DNA-processing protein DprA [Ardenticatenaceae bacterium]
MTRDLVAGLVQNNITIVSGLARGIDAIAHKTAVDLGGRSWQCLTDWSCIYPAEPHDGLKLRRAWAIISELWPGHPARGQELRPQPNYQRPFTWRSVLGLPANAAAPYHQRLEQDRGVPCRATSASSRGAKISSFREGAKLVASMILFGRTRICIWWQKKRPYSLCFQKQPKNCSSQ